MCGRQNIWIHHLLSSVYSTVITLFTLSFVVSISPLNNLQIYYPQTKANQKDTTFTLFIFQMLNCICLFHRVLSTKHLDTPSVIFGVFWFFLCHLS